MRFQNSFLFKLLYMLCFIEILKIIIMTHFPFLKLQLSPAKLLPSLDPPFFAKQGNPTIFKCNKFAGLNCIELYCLDWFPFCWLLGKSVSSFFQIIWERDEKSKFWSPKLHSGNLLWHLQPYDTYRWFAPPKRHSGVIFK